MPDYSSSRLTTEEVKAFLCDYDQMALEEETRLRLQDKGINVPEDLVEFDEDSVRRIADNLRRPGGCTPDPNSANLLTAPGLPTPPFKFGVKSQQRLLKAIQIMKYYDTVNFEIDANMVEYGPVIKDSQHQWKALAECKDVEIATLKISKALPIIKLTQSFEDFL